MLVSIEPRNVINDTLTPLGNSQVVKNYESMLRLVSGLSIRPSKHIEVQYTETSTSLGTTDGVEYTVRPIV